MRVAALVLALSLAAPVLGSGTPTEQTVTPIDPSAEQRVDPISPSGEQHIQAIDPEEAQRISEGSDGRFQRGVDAVAKATLGVMAAAISIGATIAALLFF
jgi:hypothetical protein